MVTAVLRQLSQWCAYHHLIKVAATLLRGGEISELTRAGRQIALLGLFCPFFWYALITGAPASELALHATHSGVVFSIGIVIMFVSLKKKKPR